MEMNDLKCIYQSTEWGRLQEPLEDGKYEMFEYKTDKGEIIYPFILRQAGTINNEIYYDLVTPRGECGPCIKNTPDIQEFMKEFDGFCRENNIVAELIRFSPWIDVSRMFNDYYQIEPYGILYEVDLQVDFFKECFGGKIRNIIRKSEKNEIEIRKDFCGDTIDQFLGIYNYTVEKNKVSSYYVLNKDFLEQYFRVLQGRVVIYNAYLEDTLISSAMFLDSEDIRHYHFSASNPSFRQYNANSYILYQAAIDGKEKGLKMLDLGGATEGSSLEHYKRQFVKENGYLTYSIGKRVLNKNIYDALVLQSDNSDVNASYFPAYRNNK